MLFDKTNSLVDNDAHDEEYELGLIWIELLLTQYSMHEKGKPPKGEPSPGANTLQGGCGLNQSGGSTTELDLEHNQPTQPNPTGIDLETSSRTGLEIRSRTSLATGSRVDPEPVSLSILARIESTSVNHLFHEHGRTKVCTPLIKFCLTLIQECKLDPNLKISMLSMLFSLTLSQRMSMKLL